MLTRPALPPLAGGAPGGFITAPGGAVQRGATQPPAIAKPPRSGQKRGREAPPAEHLLGTHRIGLNSMSYTIRDSPIGLSHTPPLNLTKGTCT